MSKALSGAKRQNDIPSEAQGDGFAATSRTLAAYQADGPMSSAKKQMNAYFMQFMSGVHLHLLLMKSP